MSAETSLFISFVIGVLYLTTGFVIGMWLDDKILLFSLLDEDKSWLVFICLYLWPVLLPLIVAYRLWCRGKDDFLHLYR